MVNNKNICEIAGIRIGIDKNILNLNMDLEEIVPKNTCFIVESEKYYLQKLFHSYALFTPSSIDYVRKGLSLIAHIESDATLLHGAWTKKNDKNILLLGNHGTGKSTLSKAIGEVVDDDTVIMKNELLYVPSKSGYKSCGISPNKSLIPTIENIEPKKADICFLLDKTLEGGNIIKTDEISSKYYIPNYFSEKNTVQYIKNNTFKKPKELETYILGTDNKLEKTIECIFKIINTFKNSSNI